MYVKALDNRAPSLPTCERDALRGSHNHKLSYFNFHGI